MNTEELELLSDSKYRNYVAAVDKALKNFEYSSEWADLISALGKLNKVLQNNAKYQVVPKKLTIGKRLAQCLHPALPGGVHRKALETYEIIFKIIGPKRLAKDLFLYSSGLFPLLANAAMSVKPTLLSLYEIYYLPLGKTLKPGLQGLLTGILPGLEEGSEYYERTNTLLEKVAAAVDQSAFYSALWGSLLTSPAVRLPGITYVLCHLNRKLSMEDQLYIIGSDIELMVEAVSTSVQDSSVLVQRSTLDLILFCFPFHMSQATRPDMIRILSAALHVVLRRDMSLNRRLYAWLLGFDNNGAIIGPRSTRHSNPEEHATYYFNTFSKEMLVQAMVGILQVNGHGEESTLMQDLKPFRILISLLDKPELGPAILEDVLIEVFRTLYTQCKAELDLQVEPSFNKDHTQLSSKLRENKKTAELIKTANLLFNSFEPYYMWDYVARWFEECCRRTLHARLHTGPGRGSEPSELPLTNFCLLVDFLLDIVSLETYIEIQTEHLPQLLLRMISALTSHLHTLHLSELTDSLRLCSKILSKVQPPLLSAGTDGILQLPSGQNSSVKEWEDKKVPSVSLENPNDVFEDSENPPSSRSSESGFTEFVQYQADTADDIDRALYLECSSFPVYIAEGNRTSELHAGKSDVDCEQVHPPLWLQTLMNACRQASDFSVQGVTISLIMDLVGMTQSVALVTGENLNSVDTEQPLSPNQGRVAVVIRPPLTQGNLRYMAEKTDFFKHIALTLWDQLGDTTPQHHQKSVELFYQLHNLVPSSSICEDVISQQLTHRDKKVRMEAHAKFAVLWHLTRDLHINKSSSFGRSFDRSLFIMLDSLNSLDGSTWSVGQAWLNQVLQRHDIARVLEPLLLLLLHPKTQRVSVQRVQAERYWNKSPCYPEEENEKHFMKKFNCGDAFFHMPVTQGQLITPKENNDKQLILDEMENFSLTVNPLSDRLSLLSTSSETIPMVVSDFDLPDHQVEILQSSDSGCSHSSVGDSLSYEVEAESLSAQDSSQTLREDSPDEIVQQVVTDLICKVVSGLGEETDSVKHHLHPEDTSSKIRTLDHPEELYDSSRTLYAFSAIKAILKTNPSAFWIGLITSTLPYMGKVLQKVVVFVTLQLCKNLDNLIQQYKYETGLSDSRPIWMASVTPPDMILTVLEGITTIIHYCLLDPSTQYHQLLVNVDQKHLFEARNGILSILHMIMSSVTLLWSILHQADSSEKTTVAAAASVTTINLGSTKNLRQQILELLGPISMNHGVHFMAAIAFVWNERRQNKNTSRTKVIPTASEEQLLLVELVRSISVMRTETVIQTVKEVLKQPPAIAKDKKHLSLEVCMLQFFYAYIQRIPVSNLVDSWASLLLLLKDSIQLGLPAPGQFLILGVLNEFIMKNPSLENKKDQRDLQDVTHKIVDAIGAIAGSSLEQTTWLRRNLEVKPSPKIMVDGSNLESDVEDMLSPVLETSNITPSVYSVHALTLLSEVLAHLLDMVFYSDEKERVIPLLVNIMHYVVPYLRNHSAHNASSYRACVQLLSSLSGYQYTRRAWKKEAFDLFMDSSFFQMDASCVNHWRAIMDNLMTHDKTTFRDLMTRVAVAQSSSLNLFANRDAELEQRAMLLKRLAFAIFSSEVDQYQKYLPDIQERLVESLRLPQVPTLHSQVFLFFRVLLLRMSPQHLTSLWPTMITELVQVFLLMEQELTADEDISRTSGPSVAGLETTYTGGNGFSTSYNSQRWLNLYLSACKFLDLALALPSENLPQFQMYRWAFIPEASDDSGLEVRRQGTHQREFKPYVVRLAKLLRKKAKDKQEDFKMMILEGLEMAKHQKNPEEDSSGKTLSWEPGHLLLTIYTVRSIEQLLPFFNVLSQVFNSKVTSKCVGHSGSPVLYPNSFPNKDIKMENQKTFSSKARQKIEEMVEKDFLEGVIKT
ncbi:protein dopey-1 isoform C [Alligator mississippiensis]|uniref:Protein dopey-1 isoform C n=1 Tax=Alligator mississippiensis TaxID=8496 RepID=A0A151MU00_ALLMI|nr:protein dopey-1 isoform C [Alligator mississippiensis]